MVVAADFVHPRGYLRSEWFPEGLLALLGDGDNPGWIAQGEAAAAVLDLEDPDPEEGSDFDTAVTAYVYWRGFEAKGFQMAGSPTSVSLGTLSRTTTDKRVLFFLNEAIKYKTEFETLVGEAGAESPGNGTPSAPMTRSVPLEFRF